MIKNTFAAAGGFFLLFLIFNVLDQAERTLLAWAEYQQWVADACHARQPGERAVSEIRNGKLECEIRANVGYGRAPTVVSAATLEVPR